MTTETEMDPIAEALEAEFAAIDEQSRECGIDTVDMQNIHKFARTMKRRATEIADTEAYAKAQVTRLVREREWIERNLGAAAAAATARVVEGRRAKSVPTPWGTVGLRAQGKDSVQYNSRHKTDLVAWCEEHCPEAVSTTDPQPTKGILKGALAAHLSETGEFCPLAQLTKAGRDKFYYKPPKAKESDDADSQ